MTSEELLLQMRDIHGPIEPPWWLLAPIHLWIAAIVALCCCVIWWLLARRNNRHFIRLALRELHVIRGDYEIDCDQRRLALRLSRWLKQVALQAFPAGQLQSLSGQAWLEFLDQGLPRQPFSQGCGRVFGGEVYRERVECDADQLFALCEDWLSRLQPRAQQERAG